VRPTDLQYIPERTDSIGNWTSAGLVVEVGPPNVQGQETVIARPSEPMDYKSRTFIRLRVQQNP
jgi:hypothetical protein